jgi:predicted RNA-binding protein with RPS1 domain
MQLLNRMKNCFNKDRYRFLTLTLDFKKYTAIESINKIHHFFELLRKRLKYEGYDFEYFKIIELQKNNIAHIHAIVNQYIPNDLIIKHWKEITNSFIVKIIKVDSLGKLSVYLLKYLSKNINSYHTELFYFTGKRRFSYSKKLGMEKPEKKSYIDTNIYWNNCTDFTDKIKLFLLNEFGMIFTGKILFDTS